MLDTPNNLDNSGHIYLELKWLDNLRLDEGMVQIQRCAEKSGRIRNINSQKAQQTNLLFASKSTGAFPFGFFRAEN